MKLVAALALAVLATASALAQTPSAAASPRFTLDTPIETIAADPKGKAVLDADFPEMLGHPSYPDFKAMSLTQVQPLSQGAISDAMLAKARSDLAALK